MHELALPDRIVRIVLDASANAKARGEGPIHAEASRTQIWVVPTNEELIVARLTKQLLEG